MRKQITLIYQELPDGPKRPKGATVLFTDTGAEIMLELLTHMATSSNLICALAQGKIE